MKKKQILVMAVCTVFLLNINVCAQNVSPYWSLAGNSNATGTSSLGTTNAQPLRFITNNSLRMIINSSGNVGIGTSSPSYKLHVSTSANIGTYSSALINGLKAISTSANDTAAGVWGSGRIGVRGYSTVYSGIGIAGEAPYDLFYGWDGIGVYGKGDYGVKANGQKYGVYSTASTSSEDYGVCECVAGTGVYGSGYTGVEGHGTSGVVGRSGGGTPYNIGAGVSGYGICGVYGTSNGEDSVDEFGHQRIGVKASGYYGVYSEGNQTTGYGVLATGRYGVRGDGRYGVYGKGTYGVYGASSNSGYGIYGNSNYIAVYANGGTYGVYALGGTYGIRASGSSYAGYFSGNVYASGTYSGSDSKLKKNIKPVENGLDIINRLQPKYYEFRNDGVYAKMNLPIGSHYGLIAQDVEKVLPGIVKETHFEVVNNDSNNGEEKIIKEEGIDFKAVNYTELIPVLIKAAQELNEKVNELTQEINRLKNGGLKSDLVLNDKILLQSNPNPVSGNTIITYALPDKFSKAQIMINDQSGKLLKQFNLSGKANGNLNADVSSLASGVYNYSLVIDGVVRTTKQLVIAR